MTLQQQFLTFFLMLAGSWVVGVIFDGYRVLKSKIALHKWLIFTIDVSFGVLTALFVFRLLLWSNHGQLRIVMLVAYFLGLWIYFLTMSRLFIKIWLFIYKVIYILWSAVANTIRFLVIKPVILLYQLVIFIFTFLITLIATILRFLHKIIFSKTYLVGKSYLSKSKRGFSSLFKKIYKKK